MKKLTQRVRLLHIFSLLMTALLVVVICVCLTGNRQSSLEARDMADRLLPFFEGARVEESPGRILKKYYGLDPADYDGVVLYSPLTNMDAEELLVIRLADPSQKDAVEDAVRTRQQTRIGIYEGYAPEQLALCEQAVIDICGNYVLYVVHEHASEIDAVFRSSL